MEKLGLSYDIIDNGIENPTVSIAMLSYNHGKFISQALDSVLHQKTDFSFEIIIADDFSTDNTREIIKCYQTKYPNIIKLIFQLENVGIKKNNIDLLNNINGRFVAALEGDDYWTDVYKLQKQIDFLKTNLDYSFCFTRFNTYNQQSKLFEDDVNGKHFKKENFITIDFNRFQKGWHIGTQTLVFRKESLNLEIVEKFNFFRDVHIVTQLLKKGKGACLNFFGAVYRIHDGGVHSTLNQYEKIELGYLIYKEIYEDNSRNKYLRIRHINSIKDYIISLIKQRKYKKALIMSCKLLFKNGEFVLFLKYIKRISLKSIS